MIIVEFQQAKKFTKNILLIKGEKEMCIEITLSLSRKEIKAMLLSRADAFSKEENAINHVIEFVHSKFRIFSSLLQSIKPLYWSLIPPYYLDFRSPLLLA